MKEFMENVCHKVVRQIEWCDICKRDFLKSVERIDVVTPDTIVHLAVRFMGEKERCEYAYTLVHRFIWATENEEYKQMWNDIVVAYEEKKWT